MSKPFTLRHALTGWSQTFQRERNFRFHCLATALALALCFGLEVGVGATMWVVLAACLVLLSELFNTAIEGTVNLVCPDFHPGAALAKDAAAGAVLVSACFALIVGLVVFGPHLKFWIAVPTALALYQGSQSREEHT